jgi:uncharacterized RDD family membrane protein YckC
MAEQQYGGFWARFVALILDNAIVFVILLALALTMGAVVAMVGMGDLAGAAVSVLVTLVPFLYWPVLESSPWQATIGKRVMGLQVTDADGKRLGFLRALLRALAKIISSIPLGIGFLIAAFTARKQALHDIIVKTLVVRTGPSQLWKVILALLVGFVLMVAAAAGLFYWVVMPMFKQGLGDMKVEMKSATQRAPGQARAPVGQTRAAQQAPAPVAGKPGPDPEFDAVAGKPLTGMEGPGTTRAGPAILAMDAVFPTSVWLKVFLPLPALGEPMLLPAPVVTVERVLDSAGKDYFDANSSFEKGDFFKRAQLSQNDRPVPHLAGLRSVNVTPGLNKESLQKIEGRVNFTVPVDPRSASLDAKEAGKEMRVHDSVVTLKSVAGNTVTLHFRGASEHMLRVQGYGADGKRVQASGRSTLPAKQDVDQDFTVNFNEPPAKVQVDVAAKVIERVFPFSVARGAVAGAPSAADGGSTLPQRARTASAAPAARAPAAAAAPRPAPKPEPKLEPKPEPKAEPKPEPKMEARPEPKPEPKAAPQPRPVVAAPSPAPEAAKPAPRPRPAPAPAAAPPRTLGPAQQGCVFKPVMTDEEIARCR